jgi:hypothetical protein
VRLISSTFQHTVALSRDAMTLQQSLLGETSTSPSEESARVSWWRRFFPRRGSERHEGLETTTYTPHRAEGNIDSTDQNQLTQTSIDPELAEGNAGLVSDEEQNGGDQTSTSNIQQPSFY